MENIIKESSIAQGDLVLIINNERLTKSGFWRKIRDGGSKEKKVYYVLEKPMHKDFDRNNQELVHTHKENGLFVMNDRTLRYGHDQPSEYSNINKYDILLDIRGTDAINLVNNNYDLTSINTNSPNVRYVESFLKLIEHYRKPKTENKWEKIAEAFI